jgi:two-component system OmpR family sensor kinase
MTWLWDTIAGRTILVLVSGILLSLAVSQVLYQRGLAREMQEASAARLADRLMDLRRTIARFPLAQRDEVAHSYSGGAIDVHWSEEPLAIARGDLDTAAVRLRQILQTRIDGLSADRLLIGVSQAGGDEAGDDPTVRRAGATHSRDHITLISLALDDGSWVNMSVAQVSGGSAAPPSYISTTLLLLVAAGLLAALMGRWLTTPLTRVAEGARQMFAGVQHIRVPEDGTREVRELAVAFNEMQARIKRLVDDRTDMLAAISHDLRTPLTRLRLRAEAMGDDAATGSITADLDEMEAMLDATLAFLRGDKSDEDVQALDAGAILQTIASDCEDAGCGVTLRCAGRLVVIGRHLALKRAFTNLIQNAIRHGGCAEIEAAAAGQRLTVLISDTGPGIAPDQLDAVFAPFVRGDAARSAAGAGHGLGLTVARSLIRLHGGDVTLANRPAGGLVATVTLPLAG